MSSKNLRNTMHIFLTLLFFSAALGHCRAPQAPPAPANPVLEWRILGSTPYNGLLLVRLHHTVASLQAANASVPWGVVCDDGFIEDTFFSKTYPLAATAACHSAGAFQAASAAAALFTNKTQYPFQTNRSALRPLMAHARSGSLAISDAGAIPFLAFVSTVTDFPMRLSNVDCDVTGSMLKPVPDAFRRTQQLGPLRTYYNTSRERLYNPHYRDYFNNSAGYFAALMTATNLSAVSPATMEDPFFLGDCPFTTTHNCNYEEAAFVNCFPKESYVQEQRSGPKVIIANPNGLLPLPRSYKPAPDAWQYLLSPISDFKAVPTAAVSQGLRVGVLRMRPNAGSPWGLACRSGFTDREARVACRSLGFDVPEPKDVLRADYWSMPRALNVQPHTSWALSAFYMSNVSCAANASAEALHACAFQFSSEVEPWWDAGTCGGVSAAVVVSCGGPPELYPPVVVPRNATLPPRALPLSFASNYYSVEVLFNMYETVFDNPQINGLSLGENACPGALGTRPVASSGLLVLRRRSSGDYMPICADGITLSSAAALCRSGGFLDATVNNSALTTVSAVVYPSYVTDSPLQQALQARTSKDLRTGASVTFSEFPALAVCDHSQPLVDSMNVNISAGDPCLFVVSDSGAICSRNAYAVITCGGSKTLPPSPGSSQGASVPASNPLQNPPPVEQWQWSLSALSRRDVQRVVTYNGMVLDGNEWPLAAQRCENDTTVVFNASLPMHVNSSLITMPSAAYPSLSAAPSLTPPFGVLMARPSPAHPWGYVCDDNFDTNDSLVACRSLGFVTADYDNSTGRGGPPAFQHSMTTFGLSTASSQPLFYMDDVYCDKAISAAAAAMHRSPSPPRVSLSACSFKYSSLYRRDHNCVSSEGLWLDCRTAFERLPPTTAPIPTPTPTPTAALPSSPAPAPTAVPSTTTSTAATTIGASTSTTTVTGTGTGTAMVSATTNTSPSAGTTISEATSTTFVGYPTHTSSTSSNTTTTAVSSTAPDITVDTETTFTSAGALTSTDPTSTATNPTELPAATTATTTTVGDVASSSLPSPNLSAPATSTHQVPGSSPPVNMSTSAADAEPTPQTTAGPLLGAQPGGSVNNTAASAHESEAAESKTVLVVATVLGAVATATLTGLCVVLFCRRNGNETPPPNQNKRNHADYDDTTDCDPNPHEMIDIPGTLASTALDRTHSGYASSGAESAASTESGRVRGRRRRRRAGAKELSTLLERPPTPPKALPKEDPTDAVQAPPPESRPALVVAPGDPLFSSPPRTDLAVVQRESAERQRRRNGRRRARFSDTGVASDCGSSSCSSTYSAASTRSLRSFSLGDVGSGMDSDDTHTTLTGAVESDNDDGEQASAVHAAVEPDPVAAAEEQRPSSPAGPRNVRFVIPAEAYLQQQHALLAQELRLLETQIAAEGHKVREPGRRPRRVGRGARSSSGPVFTMTIPLYNTDAAEPNP